MPFLHWLAQTSIWEQWQGYLGCFTLQCRVTAVLVCQGLPLCEHLKSHPGKPLSLGFEKLRE